MWLPDSLRRRAAACVLALGLAYTPPLHGQACGAPAVPPPLPDGASAPWGSAAARSRQVDALFAPWAERAGPGVAVLVTQNGRVLHMKGYGVADVASRTPISARTQFDLASLTKQFTAMAVMQLAEQGRLSLRDTLPRFLPAFGPRYSEVTVRDLLNHSAGVEDYIQLFRVRGPRHTAFPRAARGDSAVAEPSMAEMLDTLAARPPRFRATMGWDYSNSGYLLAAAVVEEASRQPFPEYVRERIFAPAGMRSSTFARYGDEDLPARARSYTCQQGRWTRLDYSPLEHMQGAVGVVTTLEDLARWYAALDAATLVRREVQDEAFRTGYLSGGQPTEYGLGWAVASEPGEERATHGGWWKGFRNIAVRYPRERLTVVLLSNDAQFAPHRPELAYRTARLFLPPPRPAGRRAARELAPLAGVYATRGGDELRVQVEGGSLYVTAAPGKRMRLEPLDDGSFRVAGLEEDRIRFTPAADRNGARMVHMRYGFGNTVRTWTVAYRR